MFKILSVVQSNHVTIILIFYTKTKSMVCVLILIILSQLISELELLSYRQK